MINKLNAPPFFGCIKKGFDFLGVHFAQVTELASAAIEKHRATLAQRNAQGASLSCIGNYVVRWTSWCRSVLSVVLPEQDCLKTDNMGGNRDGFTCNEPIECHYTAL